MRDATSFPPEEQIREKDRQIKGPSSELESFRSLLTELQPLGYAMKQRMDRAVDRLQQHQSPHCDPRELIPLPADMIRPRASMSAPQIGDSFRYLTAKPYRAGETQTHCTVYGLRHASAACQYGDTRDVYLVKLALGRVSMNVMERYLRSVGVGGGAA
jgi:hypothetical protein